MDGKNIKSFFLQNWIWLLPLLPTFLMILVLGAHQGVRLTFDSQQFLCAADSFRQQGQLLVCDGEPMVLSAPAFSILLSLFAAPIKAYSFVSPFLYYITLSCWLYVAKKKIAETLLVSWPLLLGLPLFYPFLFLWSEGPFMAMFSIGIWGIEKTKASNDRRYLLATLLCFPLAVSFRYAGLFLVLPVVSWEFFEKNRKSRKYLAVIFLSVILVASAMAIRNWFLSHSLSGLRADGASSFWEVLYQCVTVIANWAIPVSTFGILPVVIALLIGFAFAIWKGAPYLPLIGIYCLLIAMSASATDIEHDERLFVPVYPLFTLSVSYLFLRNGPNKWRYAACFLWLVYLLVRFVKNIYFWCG